MKVPFTPSWRAFTFPVATVSSALMPAYEKNSDEYLLAGAIATFAVLVCLVVQYNIK